VQRWVAFVRGSGSWTVKLNVVLPFWTSWSWRWLIWMGGVVAAGRAEGRVARSRRVERRMEVAMYMLLLGRLLGVCASVFVQQARLQASVKDKCWVGE